MTLISLIHRFLVLVILGLSCLCGMTFFIFNNKVVDFSVLEHYNPGKPTILLDDQGNEWTRFELDRREPVTIDKMPRHLLNAFIAAEDHEFYHHGGISWKGIVRSLLVNIYNGKRTQGASTITQQLVKLLFFHSQKTFERKIKEQFYALLVERQFSKDQILEIYLNHLYFGSGIYGVEAACQRFWGISVKDVSVAQSAILAGIIRSPFNYCPLQFPFSAMRRRNIVLRSMKRIGFIGEADYQQACATALELRKEKNDEIAPHLKESLRQQLEGMIGRKTLYQGGLIVQTTLNRDIQKKAQRTFKEQCNKLRKTIPDVDGALISMDVRTGQIKAVIGGMDFEQSKFNRAFQARRQLGSIFKPIIYTAAIENGRSFNETDMDEPFELLHNNQLWKPQNHNFKFEGQMTLARALSHSNNIITIKTLLAAGCEKVKTLGEKCHITGLQPYPSLALGCVDVTLFQAAGLFNIFANAGTYVEPHCITWIKDEWGNKVYKYTQQEESVISSRVASQVGKVLTLGMERMRNHMINRWIDSDAMGKTGTTNDCRTCWFCGSTPTITTAVYIGCDDNRSMGHNIFPYRTAFPIWLAIHKSISSLKKKFSFDPSLKEIMIDGRTGALCVDIHNPHLCSILV